MTVKQLIEQLQQFPDSLRVMVNGYEGGLDDPELSGPVAVDLDVHDSDVYGPHAIHGEGWEEPSGAAMAIILARHGR